VRAIYRNLFCLVLLSILAAFVSAQQAATKLISEKGLEDALRIGGLSQGELVSQIEKRGVDFTVTPDVEKRLRAAGASDEVIAAVRVNYRGGSSTPAPAPAPAPVSPPPAPPPSPAASNNGPQQPGIYSKNGNGGWSPLPSESVTWKGTELKSKLMKFTGGLVNEQLTGEVPGKHSPTSLHSPASFYLRVPSGGSIADYLLVHLHAKGDDRDFKMGFGGNKSSDEVGFRTSKLADGRFEVDFSQGSGDYAFIRRKDIPTSQNDLPSGRVMTFQVVN
jgi:hypothetical protein